MTVQPTQPRITCCGGAFHEITVQTAGSTLSLYRCTVCDRQQWTCDGEPMARETALERLSSHYRRRVPVQRVAADEQAAATAVRRQNRAAAKAGQAVAAAAASGRPGNSSSELVDLLDGWTVLGSAS